MALQGTLDTFALPDVLRLLSSTNKTGRLRISGGRGTGSIWIADGACVGSEASGAPHADGAVDVLFELLRYAEGSFVFEPDDTPAEADAAAAIDPLLAESEKMLGEWKEIEAVVPSIDSWVALVDDLPKPEVVVDQARWRVVAKVGAGTTVRRLGDDLSLAEVPVCRAVKELVELGLMTVDEQPATGWAEENTEFVDADFRTLASSEPAPVEPTFDPEPFQRDPLEPLPGVSEFARGPAAHEEAPPLISVDDVESAPAPKPADRIDTERGPADPLPTPVLPAAAVADDEVSRQLANLSPKAAQAVAAAAQAVSVEERDAALAEVTGDDDEPINRGLLLKFLSSVRS